ncbi:MAG: hypothetical protein K6D61_01510, partial [Prevotella sp.]|nr:hypothetical protein [Prevotella sp.]
AKNVADSIIQPTIHSMLTINSKHAVILLGCTNTLFCARFFPFCAIFALFAWVIERKEVPLHRFLKKDYTLLLILWH